MTFQIKNLTSTLFLDVETVSEVHNYEELNSVFQTLWDKKARRLMPSGGVYEKLRSELYQKNAAIYAEFGKIICISVGYFTQEGQLRIKSFAGHEESLILEDFASLLSEHYDDPKSSFFCGHNIREFDIPYICRRMVKNKIGLPAMLDISGKRPWQTEHLLDTLDMWRFGDVKGYTSLALLCAVLGVESPKNDLDGSMVGDAYWEQKDLERIASYCSQDVAATAAVFLRLIGEESLDLSQVEIIPWKENEEGASAE